MGYNNPFTSLPSDPLSRLTKVKKSIEKKAKTVGKTVKAGAKTAVKGAKVGAAVAGVVADLHNPIKMGKVVVDGVRGKGWVYPGSKYIGPGNEMDLGKPKSSADAAAYEHDVAYGNYLDKGVSKKKLYLGFSKADQKLMDKSDLTTTHGVATYGGMALKKGLYTLGLTGSMIK